MPDIEKRSQETPSQSSEKNLNVRDISRDSLNREPVPREISTWLEKVEKMAVADPQVVTDDQGQPILTPSNPVNPKIVLPVTKATFVSGFKKSIEEAGRWLSVFLLRLIKKKEGQITFKPDVLS